MTRISLIIALSIWKSGRSLLCNHAPLDEREREREKNRREMQVVEEVEINKFAKKDGVTGSINSYSCFNK